MSVFFSAAEVRWQDEARCGGQGFNFVPDHETAAGLEAARAQFCNGCPVRVECLAYAVVYLMPGYWGGTSTAERRLLSYPRNRVKCPDCHCKALVKIQGYEICQGCGLSWRQAKPEEGA